MQQSILHLFSCLSAAYAVPNSGTLYGKQYIPELRGTFSTAVADSLRKHKQERMSHSSMAAAGQLAVTATAVGVPASIPRPVTVVEVTSETAAKPVQVGRITNSGVCCLDQLSCRTAHPLSTNHMPCNGAGQSTGSMKSVACYAVQCICLVTQGAAGRTRHVELHMVPSLA